MMIFAVAAWRDRALDSV